MARNNAASDGKWRVPAFLGLRNDVPDGRMKPGDLVVAENVDIDSSGVVSRRRGRRLLSSGSAHSVWTNGDKCYFAQGGQIKRLNRDFSVSPLTGSAAVLVGDSPISFLSIDDRVYWASIEQSGVIEEDACRSWGIAPPAAPALSATYSGYLPPGQYQAALSFNRTDGQESGLSPAGRITLAATGGVSIAAVSCSDPDVVSVNLYLSPNNGDEFYYADEFPVGLAHSFAGSEQDLVHAADKRHMSGCPGGQALALLGARALVANGSYVFASQAMGYELFDPLDSFEPDGSEVTILAPVAGGLFVGTRRSVFFFSGNSFDDGTLVSVIDKGAVPGSLAYINGSDLLDGQLGARNIPLFAVGNAIYFGTPDGQLIPLSLPRYTHSEASRGAAVVRSDLGFTQYLSIFTP